MADDRSRRIRRGQLTLATLMALSLAAVSATGCSKRDTAPTPDGGSAATAVTSEREPDEPPDRGGKLVVGVMAETPGWNPTAALWADAGTFVGSSVFESLMVFDENDQLQPWLAESVTPKTPGKFDVWIIKIRPGIKFHNGEAFDAHAVKLNLDKWNSIALAAVATKEMYDHASVVDDLTVEVTLTRDWSAFPAYLANQAGMQLAPAMYADPNDPHNDRPIGTGPYRFDSWVPNQSFVVRRNDSYWKQGTGPYLDEIEFRPIHDSNQRAAALQAGDIDLAYTTSAADVRELQDRFTVVTDFETEKSFIMLNTAEDPTKLKNPFKSIHARRALAYATDRERVKASVGGGLNLKTTTAIPSATSPFAISNEDSGALGYDPAKAREEIELYKQETGESEMVFTLSGQANPDDLLLQQTLEQMWKEVGITAKLETLDQARYTSATALGGFQAASFRNYAYPDPDANYFFFHSSAAKGLGVLSINFHQYKDPQIDADLDKARSTDDFAERKALYDDLTRRVNEAAINIWLFNTPYALIAQPKVRGLNVARDRGFGNFLPKPWLWTDIWKKKT